VELVAHVLLEIGGVNMAPLVFRLKDSDGLLLRDLAVVGIVVDDEGSSGIANEKADFHGETQLLGCYPTGTSSHSYRLGIAEDYVFGQLLGMSPKEILELEEAGVIY